MCDLWLSKSEHQWLDFLGSYLLIWRFVDITLLRWLVGVQCEHSVIGQGLLYVRSSQSRPIQPSGQEQMLGRWQTPPFWHCSQHTAEEDGHTHTHTISVMSRSMNYWTTVIFKWNNVGHTMRSQSDTIGQWFSKLSLIAPRGWRLEHQWVGNQKNKVCSRTTREQVSTDDRLVPGTVRGRTTLVLQYDNGYLSLDFHGLMFDIQFCPQQLVHQEQWQ